MKLFFLIFVPILISRGLASDSASDSILGIWLTADEKAKIKIYKHDGKYHGKIVWLVEPNDENGNPRKDKNNPDPEKRNRKIMGMNLVWGFEFAGDRQWEDGQIYDPRDGEIYSCSMELSKDGRYLEVRGYVGISLFGKTVVWTRVE